MIQRVFHVFVYVSIMFLVWRLYQQEFLVIPAVESSSALIASGLTLLAGFAVTVEIWRQFFTAAGFPVERKECLKAAGFTVFGKYIPGKIWLLMGVSGYIAQRYRYPMSELTVVAFKLQFCQLWVGLIVGTAGLFAIQDLRQWSWLIGLMFIGLSILIFSRSANNLFARAWRAVFKKTIDIPVLTLRSILPLLPNLFLNWIFWCAGFYFLLRAFFPGPIPMVAGNGFAIATTLGVMAVIAPGGMGVREGVLFGYLTSAGLSVEVAATGAALSRVWFLFGEACLFIAGLIASRSSPPATS